MFIHTDLMLFTQVGMGFVSDKHNALLIITVFSPGMQTVADINHHFKQSDSCVTGTMTPPLVFALVFDLVLDIEAFY